MADPAVPDWRIRPLGPADDRAGFDCGTPSLNEWLRKFAGQFDRRGFARIHVAVRSGDTRIAAYYALCTHQISRAVVPDEQLKGLPKLDWPAVLLGRLAVDRTTQGKGLGSLMLLDALSRVAELADHVGICAAEVDAIDERARAFYLKFGFLALKDDPNHLFLPIQAVRKLRLPPPAP